MKTQAAIGAHALIRWKDTGKKENVYVSFSEWEDDATTDRWGVDDDEIFFYFPQGEKEMSDLNNDCEIVSYETVTITTQEGNEMTPCDECGELIKSDIHAEELGMCIECSNKYWSHEGEQQ